MELGMLRQYEPRRLHAAYPNLGKEDNALPAIAIVTPSFNQGGDHWQTVESVMRQITTAGVRRHRRRID